MKIEFTYSKRADKFFDKHTNLKEEFEKNLISYFKGNKNIDIKSLQGLNIPIYRMHLRTYRIIFTRKNESIIIVILLMQEIEEKYIIILKISRKI